jgi:hypothetical protein
VTEIFSKEKSDDIKAYCEARDKAVLDGVDALMLFAEKHGNPFPDREMAEFTMHKMRIAIESLPEEVRTASKTWLSERGYHS